MTRRFLRADAEQKIPTYYWAVEVVIRATGEKPTEVISANAKEGWFVRYVRDEDDKLIFDGDFFKVERVEAEIDILPGPKYPPKWLDANIAADVTAHAIFDEDLTLEDRAFLDRQS